MAHQKEVIREHIRKSYAEIALNGGGCGCGCDCNTQLGEENVFDTGIITRNIGYSEDDLKELPQAANMGLGCGNPIAIASLKEGEVVLDLGSGGGLDCFFARNQVGETGFVIGVDMTPEMIKRSRDIAEKEGYENVDFRLGEIENLPVANETIDVIISNCVINLSLDKERVFSEAFRVLKPGGRLAIADIVATAELPEEVKNSLAMMAGCIAGAEFVDNLKEMLNRVGFSQITLTPKNNSQAILDTWAPGKQLSDYIASYMIEAVK